MERHMQESLAGSKQDEHWSQMRVGRLVGLMCMVLSRDAQQCIDNAS